MTARRAPRKDVRVFLAEWRAHFGFTQQQIGDQFDPPTDKGAVSRYETAAFGARADSRSLSLGVLAAYAEALSRLSGRNIHPADLYRRPDEEESLDSLVAHAPKALREIAREQVAALVKRNR